MMKSRIKRTHGVYTHSRPNGVIFYIGKGAKCRATLMIRRNKWHMRIIKKHGPNNIIVKWKRCKSEKEAFAKEIALISSYKRRGIKLVNLSIGGDGPSGHKRSMQTRKKIGIASKKHWKNKKHREKMSIAIKEVWKRPKYRAKMKARSKRLSKDPKFIKKAKLAAQKRWRRKSYRIKTTNSIKIATKKSWCNKFTRESRIIGLKRTTNLPDQKNKRSRIMKRLWKNKNYRRKIIQNTKNHWKIRLAAKHA